PPKLTNSPWAPKSSFPPPASHASALLLPSACSSLDSLPRPTPRSSAASSVPSHVPSSSEKSNLSYSSSVWTPQSTQAIHLGKAQLSQQRWRAYQRKTSRPLGVGAATQSTSTSTRLQKSNIAVGSSPFSRHSSTPDS